MAFNSTFFYIISIGAKRILLLEILGKAQPIILNYASHLKSLTLC